MVNITDTEKIMLFKKKMESLQKALGFKKKKKPAPFCRTGNVISVKK